VFCNISSGADDAHSALVGFPHGEQRGPCGIEDPMSKAARGDEQLLQNLQDFMSKKKRGENRQCSGEEGGWQAIEDPGFSSRVVVPWRRIHASRRRFRAPL